MGVVLYHLGVSHYNEKVRFALAYKGIAHERRTPAPVMHGFTAMRVTRGRHRRLPVIDLEGRCIGDSTAIIAALEEYQPDPPLYPADPADRTRALALEDFFDEQLAPYVRAFVFASLFDSDIAPGPVIAPQSSALWQRMVTAAVPLARRGIGRDYGTPLNRADEHRARVVAAMDRVESELQPSGYLAGDRFSVADLAGAALFTPILDLPGREHMPSALPAPVLELRAELAARPGAQWAHEIFAKHRRTTGSAATASA